MNQVIKAFMGGAGPSHRLEGTKEVVPEWLIVVGLAATNPTGAIEPYFKYITSAVFESQALP